VCVEQWRLAQQQQQQQACQLNDPPADSHLSEPWQMHNMNPVNVPSLSIHHLNPFFAPCHRLPQVTNPPIDPLREGLVMSLEMRLGGRGNLLQPSANTYRQVRGLCLDSLFVQSRSLVYMRGRFWLLYPCCTPPPHPPQMPLPAVVQSRSLLYMG
jgi:hypothetical protein